MIEVEQQDFLPDWFSKPADSLLSLMKRRGISAEAVASAVDGGMSTFRKIIEGTHAIDERTAKVFAEVVGGSPSFWIARQCRYEQALDRTANADLNNIESWLSLPTPDPRPRGRLTQDQKIKELRGKLAFYGVNSFDAWSRHYGFVKDATQFRTSSTFTSNDGATSLWLRQGELESALTTTQNWQPKILRNLLPEIVKLSRIRHPHLFLPKLRSLGARAGVAIVTVRAPKGCRASGASRMISSNKAMVLLSFRHLSDDHFWFTLFHEFAHLLLHNEETFVDTDDTMLDERERQANDFARACIVPPSQEERLLDLKTSRDSILRFSVTLGVAPGLIVGQLQNRGALAHDKLNYLKRRWKWSEIEFAIN